MRDYTKINAWQKADDLTVAIYEATRVFPKEEIYALTSQIRRAAYSVPYRLMVAATDAFRCLHGLIKAVEKEANPLQRIAARVSSWLVLLSASCFLKSVVSSQ